MSWILDLGGILAGVAAILSAWWSRKAKTAATSAAVDAQAAAQQTNGPLKAQASALDVLLDGQRSLGHQLGEVRDDMGRMDERLSAEIADLRYFITPRRRHRGGRRRSPAPR